MESQITRPLSALHHYRAMNIFSDDGSQVKDSTGKLWATETWHPLPVPTGLLYDDMAGKGFWMVRKPLPPVPRVKTHQGSADTTQTAMTIEESLADMERISESAPNYWQVESLKRLLSALRHEMETNQRLSVIFEPEFLEKRRAELAKILEGS